MYHIITFNTCLEGKDGAGVTDYDVILSDHFVEQHLNHALETVLATKKRLGQNRSWRLPVVVDYSTVTMELGAVLDGAY